MTTTKLTGLEESILRTELLASIMKRHGMAGDMRWPLEFREQYSNSVDELHTIYVKLGGDLTLKDILRIESRHAN